MNNCLCRQPVWLCRSPLHHLYSEKERRKTNLSKTVWDHTGRHAGSDRYEASVAAQGLLWRPTQPVRHTGNLQENYFSTLAATTRDILMWEDLWRRETSSGFCASYLLNVHLMVLKSDVFLGWTVFRQRSSFLFFFFQPIDTPGSSVLQTWSVWMQHALTLLYSLCSLFEFQLCLRTFNV